jgi:hypothetical protein
MPNPFLQPPVEAVSGAPLPDSVPASSKTIAASSEGTQLVPTPLATKALQAVVGGGDTRHSDLGTHPTDAPLRAGSSPPPHRLVITVHTRSFPLRTHNRVPLDPRMHHSPLPGLNPRCSPPTHLFSVLVVGGRVGLRHCRRCGRGAAGVARFEGRGGAGTAEV